MSQAGNGKRSKIETGASRSPAHRRVWGSILAAVGWLLSPLSWWNDLLVNVPLAYAFSLPFSLIDEGLYVPAFVLGYWLTNVVGFVLLHKGVTNVVREHKSSLKADLLIATGYTVLIALAAIMGWLPSPSALLEMWEAR